jgi:hypothetical protein
MTQLSYFSHAIAPILPAIADGYRGGDAIVLRMDGLGCAIARHISLGNLNNR